MRRNEIRAGATYTNKGAEKTTRKVIAIGRKYAPNRCRSEDLKRRNEPGVLFEQGGGQHRLYISEFAAWCGREVKEMSDERQPQTTTHDASHSPHSRLPQHQPMDQSKHGGFSICSGIVERDGREHPITCRQKDSTFEHELWRLYWLTLCGMASSFDGWEGRLTHPYAMGGDEKGYVIWEKTCRIPYMLLLSGCLPSELR